MTDLEDETRMTTYRKEEGEKIAYQPSHHPLLPRLVLSLAALQFPMQPHIYDRFPHVLA